MISNLSNRIMQVVAVVLVITCVVLGYLNHSARKQLASFPVVQADLKLSKQEAKVVETVTLNRAAVGAIRAKQETISNEATSKAIKANPVWADQRVPDDVIDAIGL